MKYFTISELCSSNTARQKGIDNTPTKEVEENLTALVDNILDPLMERWGESLIVSSGYRCEKLNTAVGGVKNSAHKYGQAADIVPQNKTKEKIRMMFKTIQEMGLPFDQLINESNYSWVHISFKKDGNNRKQVLKL